MLPLDTSDPSKLTAGAPFDAATAQTVKTSTMLSGMTGVFNSDSIGYDKTVIPHVDSWAELFNPQYKGKVALINDPQIGPIDAALAAQASGKLKFGNIGNMTKGEIDNLTKLLIDMKKAGFFRAFWATFTESVNLMAGGEVVIESMWSPAQTVLLEAGKKVGFAAPKEGMRGWCGCTVIYKHVSGTTLDAAYKYLNWWLSGWPGANMARQAYYSPRPDTTKKFLSKAEWDYWYGGKPAATNLVGPGWQAGDPEGRGPRGRLVHRSASVCTLPGTRHSRRMTTWAPSGITSSLRRPERTATGLVATGGRMSEPEVTEQSPSTPGPRARRGRLELQRRRKAVRRCGRRRGRQPRDRRAATTWSCWGRPAAVRRRSCG